VRHSLRLWSLHPSYLDPQGLVALWREGLLAQAVLDGRTRGYLHHPQLERFKRCGDPVAAIGRYLAAVAGESRLRGYRFDSSKILRQGRTRLSVTRGQLELERRHLLAKLLARSKARAPLLAAARPVRPHPMFQPVAGAPAPWERSAP
jgi:hypothetical protein